MRAAGEHRLPDPMAPDVVTMDKIVALCKRRGLIFPASEIYGGIGNTYDYGHYGVLLKNNVKEHWWRAMVQQRDDIVALDSAIIQHPRTWEASGHLKGFADPLVECKTCKQRFRADHLDDARVRSEAFQASGRGRRLRPQRGTRLQPDVRDPRRRGARLQLDRLSAAGDGAGHLPQLQERAPVRPQEAAVRDRPGRQVLPQRDHARQLHLPHARVRADGDGVLRPARRRRSSWYEYWCQERFDWYVRLRHPPGPPQAAPARVRRAVALLERHVRRGVPVPDRLAGARGRSPTAATSTSRSTPSTPARSCSSRMRTRASSTCHT